MKKITPFLWFDNQAEEAVNFYTSIFDNSEILSISRYGEAGPGEPGSVMTIAFRLADQELVALNGGPIYHFTPAISLSVDCKSQEEVDRLWERFSADGGEQVQCGWITDKYGLSWQIIPTRLVELLSDPDPEKSSRVMEAMLGMVKIDLAAIEAAYRGEAVA
ncbi:MAG: VOC family protein [Desulfobulbaceae bacterium]|nr:VOC family protein [Desulfobulbaceae bacterium]